jgi:2'-5' RNA ligase
MRVFAALVPPAAAVEDLGVFLEPRREAGGELRWTDPEQWHVTLAFMPQVAEHVLDALADEVAAAVRARAPLALRVEGGGAFPHPYAARVLWAGVEGGEQALSSLTALARGVRQAANRAGAAPEGGRFHPHVTVARLRRPAEAVAPRRGTRPPAAVRSPCHPPAAGVAGRGWTRRGVCAPGRTRTCNLRIRRPLRYPLRHGGLARTV